MDTTTLVLFRQPWAGAHTAGTAGRPAGGVCAQRAVGHAVRRAGGRAPPDLCNVGAGAPAAQRALNRGVRGRLEWQWLALTMRGSFHEEMGAEGIKGGLSGDVDACGFVDPAGLVVEEVVVIRGGGGIGIAAPEAET